MNAKNGTNLLCAKSRAEMEINMIFFHTDKTKYRYWKTVLSVVTFLLILVCITNAVTSISNQSASKQLDTLEHALQESTVQYYAIEGYYPENLDSLLEKFHISYDKTKFFIDYRVIASNIMPEITVMQRRQVIKS